MNVALTLAELLEKWRETRDIRLDVHLDDNLVPRVVELLPHPKHVAKLTERHWRPIRRALDHIEPKAITEVILRPNIELTPTMREELERLVATRYGTKLNTPLTSAST